MKVDDLRTPLLRLHQPARTPYYTASLPSPAQPNLLLLQLRFFQQSNNSSHAKQRQALRGPIQYRHHRHHFDAYKSSPLASSRVQHHPRAATTTLRSKTSSPLICPTPRYSHFRSLRPTSYHGEGLISSSATDHTPHTNTKPGERLFGDRSGAD